MPGGTIVGALIDLLIATTAWALAWQLWRYHRAHRFLLRRPSREPPRLERIQVQGLSGELFHDVPMLEVAQDFRRRRTVSSNDLDIDATIEQTVRQGGGFSPVYRKRKVTPEYLVLVERRSLRDQQARFVDELVGRLAENEVHIERYYFGRDPRICYPSRPGGKPLTLRQLSGLHPEHRLLLFSESEILFDPLSGDLQPWVEELEGWPDRALLIPERPEHWKAGEAMLGQRFLLQPATVEGLAALIGHLSLRSTPRREARRPTAPFPAELLRQRHRWLARHPPHPRLVERVVAGLRRHLGAEGFYWLSACAVYPELHWNLTLHLGNALSCADGEPLLSRDRLGALVRLPWFRQGSVPDWLRRLLLDRLAAGQEREIRERLEELLMAALRGPLDVFHLEIARRHRASIAWLSRPVARLLSQRAEDHSPVKDHVFLTFIATGPGRRLAVRFPRKLAAHSELAVAAVRMWLSATLRGRRPAWPWLTVLGRTLSESVLVPVAPVGRAKPFEVHASPLHGLVQPSPLFLIFQGTLILAVLAGGLLAYL